MIPGKFTQMKGFSLMENENKIASDAMSEIDKTLKSFSVKETKLKDITIRVGSKILKYELVSNTEYDMDKEIRDEYNKILSDKMKEIRNVINTKFNDTLRSLQMTKDEFTRKEQLLLDKLKKAAPMPEVTMEHARRGLSIIKGDRPGEIIWFVRRTYWPKTIDGVKLAHAFIEKYITPIYVMIITNEHKVMGVSTRKLGGLELFQHYHQSNPDCWGRWKYASTWKEPNDLIKIADEAEAVLENINTMSIAKHEPLGLPKLSVLQKHLRKEVEKKEKDEQVSVVIPNQLSRLGTVGAEDVWTL